MTLPVNVGKGYVTGTFMDSSGTLAEGTVTFTPSPAKVLDATATPPTTILPQPVVVTLAEGTFLQQLVATDDADLNPSGWTYTVSFRVKFGPLAVDVAPFSISLPTGASDSPVDLTLVSPVASIDGTFYTRGPGVPDATGGSDGDALVLVDGVPAWAPALVPAPAPSGGDDLAAISSLLSSMAMFGAGEMRFGRGHWKFSSGNLPVPSNTAVTGAGSGATILEFPWHDFVNGDSKGNYYIGNASHAGGPFTGSIAASSTALSATGSPFTSAMVGTRVYVPGAGFGGNGLTAVISAYTDANHVTLDTAATGTVAGASCIIATNDSKIVLKGFTLLGGGNGLPSGPNALYANGFATGIAMRCVLGLTISDVEITKVPGISLSYQGSQHVRIYGNNVHDNGRDGITGTGYINPLYDVAVFGNTIDQVGDDAISFNGDFPGLTNTYARGSKITCFGNTIRGDKTQATNALGRGIYAAGIEDFGIFGNVIEDTFASAVLVTDMSNAGSLDPSTGAKWRTRRGTISGNTIRRAGQNLAHSTLVPGTQSAQSANGITLQNCDNVLATPNTISDSYGQNVWQSGCTSCWTHGNADHTSGGNLSDPAAEHAIAVSVTNIASLTTTTTTIDGYTLQPGDVVLLVGQTTASQNGLWKVPPTTPTNALSFGTAWLRPGRFPSGLSFNQRNVYVAGGSTLAGTTWRCGSSTALLVDTSSQSWWCATDLTRYVAADETPVNASTTPVASPNLTVTLQPNAVYEVRANVRYDASTAADFKIGWSVPSGATGQWTPDGYETSLAAVPAGVVRSDIAIGTGRAVGGLGVGTILWARPVGTITTGATGGTLALTYCQSVSDATNATLRAGSSLVVKRLA